MGLFRLLAKVSLLLMTSWQVVNQHLLLLLFSLSRPAFNFPLHVYLLRGEGKNKVVNSRPCAQEKLPAPSKEAAQIYSEAEEQTNYALHFENALEIRACFY